MIRSPFPPGFAPMPTPARPLRHLVLVLGDQLDARSSALEGFDPARDRVLMVEAPGESALVWSAKPRIAVFLAAMRHFAKELGERGIPVDYLALGTHPHAKIEAALADAVARHRPARIVAVEPGEWRLERSLEAVAAKAGVPLAWREDAHFLVGRREFADWARGYRQLRMEHFYRWMRKRTGVLMTDDEPAGGRWNFDAENREAFGKDGPAGLVPPPRFAPDATTAAVLADVERHFPGHPGSLADFAWPVARADALAALQAFVRDRLPAFGRHQDAMWTGQPFLHHSLLSAALNLKLLDPREVVGAAERAYREGRAGLESVEGFVRQVLGWREFIRGIYWLDMPGLREANHFGHDRPLPRWYWTGETRMNCLREAIGQTLGHGYAHHIQRLMLTGQFGLLARLDPKAVADWYLAVYVDAVEWAELPNVAGMALYANGGRFTSKPYVASGAYVDRMSDHCRTCAYRPKVATGPKACPLTTLYWHFLATHEDEFAAHPRTALMIRNLRRMSADERQAVSLWAERLLADPDAL
jgi:deoxyribodipyrimidine photolyase-related protein